MAAANTVSREKHEAAISKLNARHEQKLAKVIAGVLKHKDKIVTILSDVKSAPAKKLGKIAAAVEKLSI